MIRVVEIVHRIFRVFWLLSESVLKYLDSLQTSVDLVKEVCFEMRAIYVTD